MPVPRPWSILPACALCLALAACAGGFGLGRAAKTGESLDAAELAVARADQARVGDYAAQELRDAHAKLGAARLAARRAEVDKDSKAAQQARWLAEEARLDAELGVARAQQAKANAVLLQRQRAIDEAAPPPAAVVAPGEPQ